MAPTISIPPPEWLRRIVNDADHVPLADLNAQIKGESALLPELLRTDGEVNVQAEREALLSLKMKAARNLEGILHYQHGTFERIPDLPPSKLREALADAAADLPRILDHQGAAERAWNLYRVKVLCHRLLAMMLGWVMLCDIICRLEEHPALGLACQEIYVASIFTLWVIS